MPNEQEPTPERLATLRAMPYTAYLSTPEWRRSRDRALARARWRCEWTGCAAMDDLAVHHRSYEHLGAERETDLQVLCRGHHQSVHTRYEHMARVHWRVIRDVVNAGPFESFADFVGEVKNRLAALHIRIAAPELHDMLSATLRDVPLDVPTHPRRVDVRESGAHISESEACAVLASLGIGDIPSMTAVRQLPDAEIVYRHWRADQRKAYQLIQQQILETAHRVAALEDAAEAANAEAKP
jgi:hypothetical protein